MNGVAGENPSRPFTCSPRKAMLVAVDGQTLGATLTCTPVGVALSATS
jgi:hypothetical protein